MKLVALIFTLNIFARIHGYTPTYRNEATHPLKAPTESTLGLQVNDDTAARTRSNEPAMEEPVFSGGNHFEYMLLNDSNILLTSLQNDGPFDTAAAQFASKKHSRRTDQASLNTTTDATKSVQIEATLSPHNLTVQNESNSTFRIISKTNFKVEPPIISSRPAMSGGSKSAVDLANGGPQSVEPQKNSFDQRSLKTTKFLVNPLTKTEPDDYDDAYTKVLISNGILKPIKLIPQLRGEDLVYNHNVDDVDSLLAELKWRNESTYNDSVDFNTSLETPIRSGDGQTYLGTTILEAGAPENETNTALNVTVTDYSIGQTVGDSVTTGQDDHTERPPTSTSVVKPLKSSGAVNRKIVSQQSDTHLKATLLVNLDAHEELAKRPSGDALNSNVGKVPLRKSPTLTEAKSYASENFSSSDNSADERTDPIALVQKNEAGAPVNSATAPVPVVASLKKPPPARSLLREFENASSSSTSPRKKAADAQLTIPEFEDMLKSMVEQLFNAVTNYVGRLNKPAATTADSLMHIKSFVLFNVTMVERRWLRRSPSPTVRPSKATVGASCTFPWTNLRDNRTVNVHRHMNDLFDDDSADFFWFGIPLKDTKPYPLLMKETFCDLFETDLAVRIYLEYQGRKIEAIFALPRALAPNISMSAANLSVDVNAHTRVDSNRSVVTEMQDCHVTAFNYGEQFYYTLQLGTSKLIPPKAMAKVWTPQHEDIETFINFILGSLCLFCFLSFMLYGVYRLVQIHPPLQSFRNFRDRYRFLERPKADRRRRRSEALNVIFSENFDNNKHVNSSWLGDNSQHTSCILKPCKEMSEKPSAYFASRERDESGEHSLVDAVPVDSPRLNKENRVPMMGYRSYCILLPHTRPFDDEERCFENPNYRQDTR